MNHSLPENALAHAASAYLRSARHQPIRWREWSPDAFAEATAQNKPILLDIGAVWCHWCHVMDRESYEDPATAQLLNDHFICIKVDRDERPDVDARYQAAVSAITGQGGWPLTAFLTPDGKPFFGGGYFPPEDRYGRPSFRRVLATMANAFYDNPAEVAETAASVMESIESNETFAGRAGNPGRELLSKMLEHILTQHDARNGGFGGQPKFPHTGALDLLIDAAGRPGPLAQQAKEVATLTLHRMAAGGIHDHLAGGFHRYSVDEHWIVPHFEKMSYDNSELLKNYAHAYSTFGDETFAHTGRGILRFFTDVLSDQARGGFYASQDADVSLDDDGDYFTWTRDEAAAALTPAEFAVAAPFFNLRPVGDMHHNPQKNVLHTHPIGGAALPAIARSLNLSEPEAAALLAEATRKLHAARLQRKTPFVDKTVYTGWNAMCISAHFAAARAFSLPAPAAFAQLTLDRILTEAWSDTEGLAHVAAYGEPTKPQHRIPAILDDYALLAIAALDAWEYTADLRYFEIAKTLSDKMIALFYDHAEGAFFDTTPDPTALGALTARRKPIQDAPTPSGNASAASALLRLAALTPEGSYAALAQQTLETFAGVVEHFGLYTGSYGLALRCHVEGPEQLCILNNPTLAQAAEKPFAINRSILHLTTLTQLPPSLAETVPHIPEGAAILCRHNSCQPPIQTPEALQLALTP